MFDHPCSPLLKHMYTHEGDHVIDMLLYLFRWLTAGKDESGAKVKLTAIQQHPKQSVSSVENKLGATPTRDDTTPTYLSDEFEMSSDNSSPRRSPVVGVSSYQEMDSSITNQYIKQLR